MSKTPPGETTPDEAVDVDLADLSARLAMLEKSQIPIYVGMAVPYLGTTIAALTGEQEVKPAFLLANGASVGRTKWPQLFNEYGTKYGSVDSATFTLPNMLGRVLVPRNTSGAFLTGGATGGVETVALALGEMPAHTHTPSGGGNFAGIATAIPYGEGTLAATGWRVDQYAAQTGSAGLGTAHDNKMPYLVIEGWLVYAGIQAL
jgi:microcystin-dependent protein